MTIIRHMLAVLVVATIAAYVPLWRNMLIGAYLGHYDAMIADGAVMVTCDGPIGLPELKAGYDVDVNIVPRQWFPLPSIDGPFVVVPLWSVVLLAGASWLCLTWRACEANRRQSSGVCGACGYDLRGCPSGVCSECGRHE